MANTPKILLLGAGESGKSTIIKQMRILNNVPFTEYERELYRVQVFYNLTGGMRSLLEAMRELAPLDDDDDSGVGADGGGNNDNDKGKGSDARPRTGDATAAGKRRRPVFQVDPASIGTARKEDPPRKSDVRPLSTVSTAANQLKLPPDPSSSKLQQPQQPQSATSSPQQPSPPHSPTSEDPTPPPAPGDTSQDSTGAPAPTLADTSASQDSAGAPSADAPDPSALSRSPTRSPSLSLNIFHPGALSQRQHAALLNELHYVPDIRPGEPFPMEYEGLLSGLWWGWEDEAPHPHPAQGQAGPGPSSSSPARRRTTGGVGQYLDRIQSETGIALPDNLTYFFASPDRLSSWFGDDYVPSDEDVLRCRGRTTGIQETVFTLGKSGLGAALRERRRAAAEQRKEQRGAGTGGGGGLGGGGLERVEEITTTGTGGGGGGVGTQTQTMASGTTTLVSASGSAGMGVYGGTHASTSAAAGGGGGGHTHPPHHQQQLAPPLRIPMGKTRLHLVDVGGQRSERRKWMHCFQDVTAVLFLVGLSGYSQGMLEDATSNQMQDAMALWDGVCSSQWFRHTSLILFLNKKDLFAEKMGKFPIKNYFPDYEGGDTDVTAGMDYFKRRFIRIYAKSSARRTKPSPTTSSNGGGGGSSGYRERGERGKGKSKSGSGSGAGGGPAVQKRAVYTHFTTATDTMQLRLVIVAVCDIILRDNLVAAHFL